MFLRGNSEEIQSDWGCGTRAARENRERRGYRQHVVAAAGGRGAERHRGRVSPSELSERPRNQRGRVDCLRCALRVLQRDGKARKAERGFPLMERISNSLGIERNVAAASGAVFLVGLGEGLWKKFLPKYLESLGAYVPAGGLFGMSGGFFVATHHPPPWVAARY